MKDNRTGLTFFFGELMEQARFSNSHIPDDDIFKYVGIIIRTRRHAVCYENNPCDIRSY